MNRANRPGPFWWRNLFPTDSVATNAICMNLDPATINSAELCAAIEKGEKLKVKLLLAKGALANEFWGEPLFTAMLSGDLDMVEILLSAGAHPDGLPYWIGEDDCTTSLYYAAENGMTEMVQLLLSKGADVNTRNYAGWTPIICNAIGDNPEMIELLISKGADVNASTHEDGMTALMFAAEESPVEIAELLISKGAQVNAKDSNGCTPLMHAAMDGDADMCEYLISQGAIVHARDNDGWTAADHYYSLPTGLAQRIPGPEAFDTN